MTVENELLNQKQAAKFLGLSHRTLERWRCTGGGPPFIRVSNRAIRYAPDDLHEWLENRKRENTSQE